MILVFGMAAMLWGMGHLMKAPKQARWSMIALLYVAVLVLHLLLPDSHPLRESTGGSAAFWALLGGAVALILTYRQGLRALRARSHSGSKKPEPIPLGKFSEVELERYARHIVLREVGGTGQKALKNARVLVIGAGGLGSPALLYLAASGVGQVGVIDDDLVENTNLQRQVIHRDDSIGMPKVFSAQAAMKAQNPFVDVRPYHRRLSEDMAVNLFSEYDVILDGTDNFETRYLANRVAAKLGKPLIAGALSQWEGQLSLYHPAQGGPCYQCIFPDAPAAGLAPSCAEAGVIGPLPGVLGAMMAVETIKVLTKTGETLQGQMLFYDALYGSNRTIKLRKRPDCPVCGTGAE